jgi:hypothetical protein
VTIHRKRIVRKYTLVYRTFGVIRCMVPVIIKARRA